MSIFLSIEWIVLRVEMLVSVISFSFLYTVKAVLKRFMYSFWCAGVVFELRVKVVKNLVSWCINLRAIASGSLYCVWFVINL